MTVQVVSLDWKWLFIYPEQGIASVNTLTIPAGTPISFELTSSGVMNSFFVPQLGSQIYTMGAMTTRLQLQADRPGTYEGRSFNFSGDGFSDMHFLVHAVPPDQFTAWAAKTKGAGPTLDAQSYAELEKPSHAVPPFTYGSVSSGLFETIVSAGHAGRTLPHRRARLTARRIVLCAYSGKLSWERDPVRPADTLVRVRADDPGRRPRPRLDHAERDIGRISGASG